jgi:exonuclease SbcC
MNKYLASLNHNENDIRSIKIINKKYNISLDCDNNNQVNQVIISANKWKLNKLEFSNIFSYYENNVIDFDKMNGIVGVFAPNHSGKSAIFDIILFILFEKTSRSTDKVKLINKDKINLKCKITFELDNDNYTIERYNRGKKFYVEFKKNDMLLYPADTKTSIVNKQIIEMIGTYEDFLLTTMTLKNNNSGFVNFKQSQMKEYLYHILNLNIYEKIEQEVKTDVKILKEKIKFINDDVKQHTKNKYIENNIKNNEELLEINSELNSLNEDVDTYYQIIQDEKNKLKTEKNNNSMVTSLDPFSRKGVPTLKKENIIKICDKYSISIDTDSCVIGNEINKANEKMIRYDEKLKVLNNNSIQKNNIEFKKKINNLEKEKIKLKKDFEKIEKKNNIFSDLKKEKDFLEKKNKDLSIRIIELKKHKYDSSCSYCCSNEKVIQFEESDKELKKNSKVFKGLCKKLEKFDMSISNEFEKIKKTLLEKENEIEKLEKDENEKNEKEKKEEIETLLKKNKKCKKKIEKLEMVLTFNKLKEFYETQEYNKIIQNKINKLNNEKKEMYLTIRELEKRCIMFECNIEKNNENNKKFIDVNEKYETLQHELKILKEYLKIVSSNGIPLFMLSDSLPKIEDKINKFISPHLSFKLLIKINKNNIDILVTDDKSCIRTRDASSCSSFEQFIINFGFKIVINEISNKHSSNFIAIDEGFGCFDKKNIENIESVFNVMREYYKFVIIISHIEKLKEKVDMNVNIERVEEGYAKIV